MSRTRRARDLEAALVVTLGSVLLGAPFGLLWSALSPRVRVFVTAQGTEVPDIESNKAFVGADGSYFVIMLVAGIACGVLAWALFRRSGPVTVLALTVGGAVAALVAARVGVMPDATSAINAVSPGATFRGARDLYLGRFHESGAASPDDLSLRATWALVGWPVGALLAFLAAATIRPGELD